MSISAIDVVKKWKNISRSEGTRKMPTITKDQSRYRFCKKKMEDILIVVEDLELDPMEKPEIIHNILTIPEIYEGEEDAI